MSWKDEPDGVGSPAARPPAQPRYNRRRFGQAGGRYGRGLDFRCAHCRGLVSANRLLSGVQNRNHCPACLWSRCLDLFAPGDRLSACKAPLRPVALALKRTGKKYGGEQTGELMVVHLCGECGKVSLNRLAADDDPQVVLAVLHDSGRLDRYAAGRLEAAGVRPLGAGDADLVRTRLYGRL